MFDKLFRPLVLVLLLAILVFEILAQRQGRYQFHEIGDMPAVFDSHTGFIFQYDGSSGGWREIHPQSGQAAGPVTD
jgi:hypothetical protein